MELLPLERTSPPESAVIPMFSVSVHEHAQAVEYCEMLEQRHGLKFHVNSSVHFAYMKKTDGVVDLDQVRKHRLLQPNGSAAVVGLVCDHPNKKCLYLESPEKANLQFVIWACRETRPTLLPPAA